MPRSNATLSDLAHLWTINTFSKQRNIHKPDNEHILAHIPLIEQAYKLYKVKLTVSYYLLKVWDSLIEHPNPYATTTLTFILQIIDFFLVNTK